jgi:hypothetical protein
MAVISLDFSSVACWLSTIRCRVAQAETRCRGGGPSACRGCAVRSFHRWR